MKTDAEKKMLAFWWVLWSAWKNMSLRYKAKGLLWLCNKYEKCAKFLWRMAIVYRKHWTLATTFLVIPIQTKMLRVETNKKLSTFLHFYISGQSIQYMLSGAKTE